MTIEEIRTLHNYDIWANRQLLDVVATLTPERFHQEFNGTTTSIQQHFVHLLLAKDRYYARLNGERAPDAPPQEISTPDALSHYAVHVDMRMSHYLHALSDDDLQEERKHVTRNGSFRATTAEVLRHVINHGTYHRGQIALLLKLHGCDLPDTDYLIWLTQ